MAWLTPPIWLENSDTHNAVDYRTMLGSLTGGTSGVAGQSDLAISPQPTPNMSVIVMSGGAFIASTRSAAQGVYHAYNDGNISVPIAAADPTNPRIDRIVVQVRDEAQDPALTQNDVRVLVVQGTPAATPVAPSVTVADYLILGEVRVEASASAITLSNITDRRPRAAITGGLQYVTSTTRPAIPSQGQAIYEADTDRLLVWNGGNWVRKGLRWDTAGTPVSGGSIPNATDKREAEPTIVATSVTSATGLGGGGRISFPTPFPSACFSVVASLGSGDIHAGLVLSTKGHGLDGFDFVVRTSTTAAIPADQTVRINYIAVGW